MSYEEDAYAQIELLKLASRHRGLFDKGKLEAVLPVPADDDLMRPGEAGLSCEDREQVASSYVADDGQTRRLTHEFLDQLVRETAEKRGTSAGAVDSMIRLTAQRANLGLSVRERARLLNEVDVALRRGLAEPDREQILALSRRPGAEDVAEHLARDGDVIGMTVSAEHRRALAAKGQALGPAGDFPVHDAHHVGLAKAAYKAGKLAGHSKSVVRDHINRAAKRLNLPGLDDDGDDDSAAMTVGLTQEIRGMQLSAAGGDSAEAVVARHPELAHLFRR